MNGPVSFLCNVLNKPTLAVSIHIDVAVEEQLSIVWLDQTVTMQQQKSTHNKMVTLSQLCLQLSVSQHFLFQFSGLFFLVCFTCVSNDLLPPHRWKLLGSSMSLSHLLTYHYCFLSLIHCWYLEIQFLLDFTPTAKFSLIPSFIECSLICIQAQKHPPHLE